IVVLRSTTPWVAVNSRSNSNLLTVISMVPAATAASTGISQSPRNSLGVPLPAAFARGGKSRYFYYFLISNAKAIKPAVTVDPLETWKTFSSLPFPATSRTTLDVRNPSVWLRSPYRNLPLIPIAYNSCTPSTSLSQPLARKTRLQSGNRSGPRDLSAQLLSQFIDQPVQIFIVLADLFNLLDRMQHRCVMLAAKLPSDLRQRRFGQMLRQVHRNLPGIHNRARIVLR